jgi:hypothetical protein
LRQKAEWEEEEMGGLFNGYGVSVLQEEKNFGDA